MNEELFCKDCGIAISCPLGDVEICTKCCGYDDYITNEQKELSLSRAYARAVLSLLNHTENSKKWKKICIDYATTQQAWLDFYREKEKQDAN